MAKNPNSPNPLALSTKTKISEHKKQWWAQKKKEEEAFAAFSAIVNPGVKVTKGIPLDSDPIVQVSKRDTQYMSFVNLTAGRMRAVMDSTKTGLMRDWIRMAEDIVINDAQLQTVISARKSRLTQRDLVCQPVPDKIEDPNLRLATDLFNQNLGALPVWQLVNHLLDAAYYGFAVTELLWDYDSETNAYLICGMNQTSGMKYAFDENLEIYIEDFLTPGEYNGCLLSEFPGRFVVHTPSEIRNYPNEDGLIRSAAFFSFFKRTGLAYLNAGMAKFAFPPVFAILENHSQEPQVTNVRVQLEKFSTDSVAALKGVKEIGTITNGPGGGEAAYITLLDYLDKQISKLVLRGTGTVDDISSKSQAEVHERGEFEVVKSDATKLLRTLKLQFLKPWLEANAHLWPGVSIRYMLQNLTLEFKGLNDPVVPSIETIEKAIALGRSSGLQPTKESIERVLNGLGLNMEAIPDGAPTPKRLDLAPTDIAKVIKGIEARASQGLPAFGDDRDNKTLTELGMPVQVPTDIPPENASQGLSGAGEKSLSTEEVKPKSKYVEPEPGQIWLDTTDGNRLEVVSMDDSRVYLFDLDSEKPTQQFAWSQRYFKEIARYKETPEVPKEESK